MSQKKVHKLTPQLLRRLVLEEKEKYEKDVKKAAADTEEVEASEYADTLEKHIDFIAALKIKEAALKSQLSQIQEQRSKASARIAGKVRKQAKK